VELLVEVCRALDSAERLQEIVAAEGETVVTPTGVKVHPAVRALIGLRSLSGRLIDQLALPKPDDRPKSVRSLRAKRAAAVRWARQERFRHG
jgi:hypothetical protein